MAVYMSPNRQRRRIVGAAAIALLVGVILGVVIGRLTATSVDDEINASRKRGAAVGAALRTLPIEYEQLRGGTGGKSQVGFDDAVQRIVDQLTQALQKAPWIGPSAHDQAITDIEAVQQAAMSNASPDAFRAAVEKAAASIEDVFDAESTSGGAA